MPGKFYASLSYAKELVCCINRWIRMQTDKLGITLSPNSSSSNIASRDDWSLIWSNHRTERAK